MAGVNVAIVTPTLVEGDGVGNDVLGMASALETRGHRVHLFAQIAAVPMVVRAVEHLPKALRGPDDVLIYHHSIACDFGVRALREMPGRKVTKYHNVTPPRFFQATDARVARGCAEGVRQTADVVRSGCAIWADSPFNGEDLRRHAPGVAFEELPPFNQVDRLTACAPDGRSVAVYDDWRTNVLMVGRMVPNKNVLLGLEAFADYRRRHDPHARLVIVGDLISGRYSQSVADTIGRLGLQPHVAITGKVTLEQLKAFYLTAQALLVTSEHEGFCLPLIEAMSLRVPVVAVPNAAVPFTAGPAAAYPPADTPAAVADALAAILADEARREELVHAGWTRYQEKFTNRLIERRFLELFDRVLAA